MRKKKESDKVIFNKIKFDNEKVSGSDFDIVCLNELLDKKPTDHSQFELHRVPFYVILLITRGTGKYNINFKDYQFKKGSLFTLRKDNIHKFYKTDAEGLLLVFTEKFITDHAHKLGSSKIFILFNEILHSSKVQLSDKEYNELIAFIELTKKEYLNSNDEYTSTIVRSLMQAIFSNLLRIKSNNRLAFDNNKYLSKFIDFQELVEKNCFTNRKVTYYAKKMGISTKTLNNVTQNVLHKSSKSFINDIAIIQIKRQIINSDNSLIKISYEVGFDEPTNFFKFFKKHTGKSPSEFRDNS